MHANIPLNGDERKATVLQVPEHVAKFKLVFKHTVQAQHVWELTQLVLALRIIRLPNSVSSEDIDENKEAVT